MPWKSRFITRWAGFRNRNRPTVSARQGQKTKSSEVMLGPFVSASSSLLDPCLTCYRSFPCGIPRAIFARAPGLPPTGKTYPTPRNSILPSTFLLVLLDQRFAIDPCSPSLLIFMNWVTALESRTPHQPEKLQKLSKNDYVSTPSIFGVNKKFAFVTRVFSAECRPSTGG